MNRIFILIFSLISLVSCIKREDPDMYPADMFVSANAVFIINEGNFGWGNGSLTYFSYDSAKVHNDIFRILNQRPLGDVPYTMTINDNNAYIVVNNSGKIEVIDRRTLKSKATINGLKSPRNISFTDSHKAYVSSLYSDSVTIVNLAENKISHYINLKNTSEAIIINGKKAFVSSWAGGNEVFVIDTETDKVIDSIEVGREPESMVVDKNGILWVLCNGGWTRENFAELVRISPQTHDVLKRYIFPSKLNSPLNLQIDGDGDTLFFIDNGIRRLDITATELPAEPFIEEADHLFYKMGINPVNGDILVTDVVDYLQNGFLLIYNNNGNPVSSYQTGIIPGSLCFMVQSSHTSE